MNFDEQLDEAFEAACERATEFLKVKSNKVFNVVYLLAHKEITSFNDFHVYSYTTKYRKSCDVGNENCIFHTIRAIYSLDDLKENFERMRKIGKIKLKEFHINKQKEEIAKEFR